MCFSRIRVAKQLSMPLAIQRLHDLLEEHILGKEKTMKAWVDAAIT
jgi:hypothetical protein